MANYTLEELASCINKNTFTLEQWVNELEKHLNHSVTEKDGQKVFDDEDLKILTYIAEKREERVPYREILDQVEKKFQLRNNKDIDLEAPNTTEDLLEEKTLFGLGKDPEQLFYEIAQDNEVIETIKYHSLRVMFLSSALAKRVGCYDEDLRIAAMLHDIGKMGLSKDILMKSGKLTDLEYTIIQSHSHVGNVIVRKHLGLTHAAKYIRDHHERWDGTGYPRRLLGDEITIQGRIISICDAFDTMTFDQRDYKKEMSQEEAFKELERNSWKQFDGNLVRKFISIRDEVTVPNYMIP